MNKFSFLLVFFFAFAITASAQTKDNKEYNAWYVQKDSAYTIFAKKAMIRAEPSLKGQLIDSLYAGASIIIHEQTTEFAEVKSIYAPWVKVSYQQNGQQKSGYLWLGSVALKNAVYNNVNFVFGIERLEKDAKRSDAEYSFYTYVVQLKAISSDTLADVKEWKVDGGEFASYIQMLLLGNTKLDNLQNVVRISAGGEACGIPTNYFYYGWTGQKLLPLPGKYSVGDADVFYHSETLLFPHEKGGQPNKIIKLIEEEETLEEATETKKAKVKKMNAKEVYVWNGVKAIKQK
ncbi:hypothetical protein [Ferruginibacter sp. HRS2-29]|uniref:hypothetical protein n=1 Tax=Ferruginibacter sp. HRS2-29 TaxID=2487334 RepID=UPI0020CCA197|nr:hypothetical protein [Ferruginibacter sp. HRS2-29]MCP9750444.1 hypothetical protein [Ferruginibacter sp. HRS2-29]